MSKEIERKFLVDAAGWTPSTDGIKIAQGYLSTQPERTVRVRRKGEKGFLTVKGKNEGIARSEFEYEIPAEDADALLQLCEPPVLEKRRYLEEFAGHIWEVDVFAGANEGLVVAEIELSSVEEEFLKPQWILEEVSGDVRYYNANLVKHPYSDWEK